MILVVDNYDSFVHNVARYLRELGATVGVVRNDALSVEELLAGTARGIVISPGPRSPREAGVSVPLARGAAGRVPLLGICLGHQAVAEAFGARVVRAERPLHGRTTPVLHRGDGLFRGLPQGFPGGRYHSLTVDPVSLPDELERTAWSPDGEVLGIRHRVHPVFGVQFHPESVLTRGGHRILANFLSICHAPGRTGERERTRAGTRAVLHGGEGR